MVSLTYSLAAIRVFLIRSSRSDRAFMATRNFSPSGGLMHSPVVDLFRRFRLSERNASASVHGRCPLPIVFTLRARIERVDRFARTMSLHPRLTGLGMARLLNHIFLANRVIESITRNLNTTLKLTVLFETAQFDFPRVWFTLHYKCFKAFFLIDQFVKLFLLTSQRSICSGLHS